MDLELGKVYRFKSSDEYNTGVDITYKILDKASGHHNYLVKVIKYSGNIDTLGMDSTGHASIGIDSIMVNNSVLDEDYILDRKLECLGEV